VKREGEISRVDVSVRREQEPLGSELRGFVRSILDDREPPVTAEEGFRALELALEIQERMKDRMERVRIS
jgi:predicted dehydrogenase